MSTTCTTARPYGKYFKSSYSGNPNGECLEACPLPGAVNVRDSKCNTEPGQPVLSFSSRAWSAFADHVGS
ncbi:DUF397 domain-containing protein [Streptomyces sp. NPDC051183]|uniref:DUF397 domain-containing protein n=1 Tax=Streptomyces sp. NPDC051183 TaxID=3155165 RepID=UPI00342D47D1